MLLPSVSARREAFDEYCRDRARELRQSQVKKDKAAMTPKEEFDRLLVEEVKSTRTSWTEWRRQWKKDRRFYGWGRDDRDREKRFREYLKELGESKYRSLQEIPLLMAVKRNASLLKKRRRSSLPSLRRVEWPNLGRFGRTYVYRIEESGDS